MASEKDPISSIPSSFSEFLKATEVLPDARSNQSNENDSPGPDESKEKFPKHLNCEESLLYKLVRDNKNKDVPGQLRSMISKLPQTSMVFVINSLPNGSESVDLISLAKVGESQASDAVDVNVEGEVLEGAEVTNRRRPNPIIMNRNPENFIPQVTRVDNTPHLEPAVQKSLMELREKINQRGINQFQVISGLPVKKKVIKVDLDSPSAADDRNVNQQSDLPENFYGETCSLTNKKDMLARLVDASGKFDLTKYPTFPRGTNFTYPCPFCDYTNTKRHLIIRHLRTHSSDKPHACNQCGKTFKAADSLRIHLYSHRNVKPRQCKQCGDTFAATSGLVRHMRYKHTKEKPFKCTHCGLSFVESYKLKQHLRASVDHDHVYRTATIE